MVPFFYIMLPTFNRPDLIIRCVKSVFEQEYTNYKLVIFNDGSDKDYSRLENIISGHPKVEYIKSHNNIGINKSRNIMLEKFLKNETSNRFFFTLSDDDYLTKDSLSIMAKEIIKNSSDWYCFNCYSNSQHLFKNTDFKEYDVISYKQFVKNYKGDKHFVFKLNKFQNIRFPEKYFKNGFEHLFYYQIDSKIQIIPYTVKIIEYHEDGLSLSDLYAKNSSLATKIKELQAIKFNKNLIIDFIIFLLKPKNILKSIITEEKYYKVKKALKLSSKKIKGIISFKIAVKLFLRKEDLSKAINPLYSFYKS